VYLVCILVEVLADMAGNAGEQSEEWIGTQCLLGSDIVSGRIHANEEVW